MSSFCLFFFEIARGSTPLWVSKVKRDKFFLSTSFKLGVQYELAEARAQ